MTRRFARARSALTLGLFASTLAASTAAAPPKLRHQADQQGDVLVLGSTLLITLWEQNHKPASA